MCGIQAACFSDLSWVGRRGALRVWLDDKRDPRDWLPDIGWWPAGANRNISAWTWATSAVEAIAALETGDVDEISLDL